MAEWREIKELLAEGERGEWKAGLKLNIQKTKIMASGPITSWQIHGEKVEILTDSTFVGSKIVEDNDCSHEIKRRLLLGIQTMTNLDSISTSRDITLQTKVHLVKAIGLTKTKATGSSSSQVWMWDFSHKEGWAPSELMLSNCDAEEDSWESLKQQGNQTNQS